MKGFTNSTKTVAGHNFPRTSVAVGAHQRAMPTKTPTAPMPAAPLSDATPPSGALTTGLSPTGYAPRHTRMTLGGTGKRGLRKPRTSQLEATDGSEPGFADGGSVVLAPGYLPQSGYHDSGTHKFSKKKDGSLDMDPSEYKVALDIDARDKADIDKGKSPAASKLEKAAAREATARQNRLGIAYEGYNADTGQGMRYPSQLSDPKARAESDSVRPNSTLNKAKGGSVRVKAGDPRSPMIPRKSGC